MLCSSIIDFICRTCSIAEFMLHGRPSTCRVRVGVDFHQKTNHTFKKHTLLNIHSLTSPCLPKAHRNLHLKLLGTKSSLITRCSALSNEQETHIDHRSHTTDGFSTPRGFSNSSQVRLIPHGYYGAIETPTGIGILIESDVTTARLVED